MSTNPFLDQSKLPYQAPRFDRIKDYHYRPAFDEGVRQKRVEIEVIVNHPAAPDFTNTLLALEQSGALLSRVTSVFLRWPPRTLIMNSSGWMRRFLPSWRRSPTIFI